MNSPADTFQEVRGYLFGIAYRMLGSAMEAEDILHDAYLRYQATSVDEVTSHKAYLSTIVTRLCINHLKSARVEREVYPGTWLPEPVPGTQGELDPLAQMEKSESISMAFLVLLEQLTPVERAVFLLREVFDYPYTEIAAIVDRTEAACRQQFRRAKQHLTANRPRFQSSPDGHQAMLNQFIVASAEGDLAGLEQLLAEDVTFYGDGGGKVKGAANRPITGIDNVSRFLVAIAQRVPEGAWFDVQDINGLPALVVYHADGTPYTVVTLEVVNEQIVAIRSVANPDKLQYLAQAT